MVRMLALTIFGNATFSKYTLEATLSTLRTDGEAEAGRGRAERGRTKGIKSRNPVFLPMFCGPGGSKSRLAKAVGVEPCGQMRNEQSHAVCREADFKAFQSH